MNRFEVRLELNGANARLIVSPPSLSPYYRRRADGQLSPRYPPSRSFRLFGIICVKLLSSSCLAGQKHPSLLSRLV